MAKEGTHYPALEFEDYVAIPIINSMSKFTIKNLIVRDDSNKPGIKISELKIKDYLDQEIVFDTEITKTTKPEELYKLLLPFKEKWTNGHLAILLVENEDLEKYELVFGLGVPLNEEKMKEKMLFICNQGMHRSKTASEIFGGDYAGLYSENNPLTSEKITKADIVFVMEEDQRKEIAKRFPKEYLTKKILNLDIADMYSYGSEKLKNKLKSAMKTMKGEIK